LTDSRRSRGERMGPRSSLCGLPPDKDKNLSVHSYQ
jgi:hypothetical protein